jgi:hypothetical protein
MLAWIISHDTAGKLVGALIMPITLIVIRMLYTRQPKDKE